MKISHNAGLDDPQFIRERIAFCQAVIEHSAGWTLSMDHFNLELAQSYFAIGDPRGEELFQRMLKEEPQWGWGWIGWADCYYLLAKESRDAGRAEAILKRGLAVPDVRDRKYLLERLEFLYEETGRTDQAKVVRRQIEEMQWPNVATQITSTGPNLQIKETFDFGEEGMPIEEFGRFAESTRAGRTASAERTPPAERSERVGRNDPCPCRSGKKFKRCCGRK